MRITDNLLTPNAYPDGEVIPQTTYWDKVSASDLADLAGLKSGPGPGAHPGDFDDDGTPDLAEFRLGLIPSDPNSTLTLDVSPGPADTVALSWPSQDGLHFEIYFTEDLSLPLADWGVVPVTDDDGDGAPTHEWTDADATSPPSRIYRVGLLP